ncbi:MAG: prepilin-type N-terminal cleavage/methylation domain-containing protein [candidate division Zixibacteria bacterium]|nr:prepilin-type N-terminal cleavage/methylation domain-containing protein [candidate division Zixibacteria bacterium]MDD5426719.1 prepilin-type N-terminal cleavage/methylation domain-containing protein [candidate division Zixibacteria bacterium]
MKVILRKIRQSDGFSLLEVLIALTVTSIITLAVFRAYVTQHKNYMTQDDITEIQQNARVVIDELTRHIRMAGNQLPQGLQGITPANTNPDTITLTYRTNNCDSYLSSAMPLPSAELKCGADVSCFHDDQWVYIFEPDSGGGEWFLITHVQTGSKHIQHNTMPLSKCYGADAILLSMNQIKFFVDHTTDPQHPTLMMQLPGQTPQIFADNITDLQFQYKLKNGTIVDQPVLINDVTEVLISVTGRSRNPDYEATIVAEDPNSGYRLRTYTSTVNLRNI